MTRAIIRVCQLIVLRYVFRAPTIWQTDFVVFSATASIFLGAPYVLLTKGHVGVDIFDAYLSGRARMRLQAIGGVLGLAFCAILFAASAMHFQEAFAGGWETTGVWKIPLWIPLLPLPLGFGLLTLQYVAELLRLKEGA